MQAFGYVVIGAGSSGCGLAARVSEDPDCKVLPLEAGGDTNAPANTIGEKAGAPLRGRTLAGAEAS